MKTVICILFLSICLCSISNGATTDEPVTIDFEALRIETSDIQLFASHDEDGYHFEVVDLDPSEGPDGLVVVGALHPGFYGSVAISPDTLNEAVMTRLDGSLFTLESLKLIEHFDRNGADPSLMRTLTLTGWKSGGVTVTQTFAVDEVVGFETFAFSPSFSRLEKLTWNIDDPVTWWNHAVRVDDIVAFAVPEPATVFLVAAVAAIVLNKRRGDWIR